MKSSENNHTIFATSHKYDLVGSARGPVLQN
jgi:hypothetical protein